MKKFVFLAGALLSVGCSSPMEKSESSAESITFTEHRAVHEHDTYDIVAGVKVLSDRKTGVAVLYDGKESSAPLGAHERVLLTVYLMRTDKDNFDKADFQIDPGKYRVDQIKPLKSQDGTFFTDVMVSDIDGKYIENDVNVSETAAAVPEPYFFRIVAKVERDDDVSRERVSMRLREADLYSALQQFGAQVQ